MWDHTAAVLALLANVNRDPKKKPKAYDIADFHPYRKVRRKVATKEDLTQIRAALAQKRGKTHG